MKYQCYMVQKLGGKTYNVVLGTEFKTAGDALDAAATYEKYFGVCDHGVVEESGKPIPTDPEPRETITEKIKSLF